MTSIDENSIKVLALWLINGLGPRKIALLMQNFPIIDDIFNTTGQTLSRIEGITPNIIDQIRTILKSSRLQNEIDLIHQHKLNITTISSKDYPDNLREIFSPPPIIYYQGNLDLKKSLPIAIVGARKASYTGKSFCKKLIQQLAEFRKDIVIVSGLALGIDTVAHQTALDCGLKTIAVLAGGLSNIYPAKNKKLAELISQQGCLLTEFPVQSKPTAQHFPLRNRIISGLSQGIVVIEASEKSGALITAKDAIEQNRELFAVPGPVDSSYFKGTNRLIQRGHAKLIMDAGDILEELDRSFSPQLNPPASISTENFSKDEQLIIKTLQAGELTQNQLAEITHLPIHELLGILTNLELKQYIALKNGLKVQLLKF